MRIESLRISNFRTIESLELEFTSNYTAVCGPNDSGKTNVIRAIRALVHDTDYAFPFATKTEVAYKDDFPKWKDQSSHEPITLSASLRIDQTRDAGLYQSTLKQLSITTEPPSLLLEIDVTYHSERSSPEVTVRFEGTTVDGISAQEVLSRIQSAKCCIFHNSTQSSPRIFYRGDSTPGVLRELSPENEALLGRAKKTVNNALTKVAKGRQKEFETLLGKLERKYKLGLTLPTFDFTELPFSITLGEPKFQVPLDEWGSGTKNRTKILLALFTAKKISESEATASKTTPIIILEEPECFLHPSAQAEFLSLIHI